MADGGRKVRVNMSGELGQLLQFAASPELERLGRSAAKASEGTEKLQKAQEKAAEEQEKARQKAQERFEDARRVTLEGVGAGAVRALGQAGAGLADAGFGAARSLQAAAPGLGQAAGAAFAGPVGSAFGTLVGEGVAAGINRTVGQLQQAREGGIAFASQVFEAAAVQGQNITKEEYQEAVAQGTLIAWRKILNDANSRSAGNSLPKGFP